jgi:hypothetical protein
MTATSDARVRDRAEEGVSSDCTKQTARGGNVPLRGPVATSLAPAQDTLRAGGQADAKAQLRPEFSLADSLLAAPPVAGGPTTLKECPG